MVILKRKKVCEGHGPTARTDDVSWSPKTNSAGSAGCRIASLAHHDRIIPSPGSSAYASEDKLGAKFSGGDGLEPAHVRGNPLLL